MEIKTLDYFNKKFSSNFIGILDGQAYASTDPRIREYYLINKEGIIFHYSEARDKLFPSYYVKDGKIYSYTNNVLLSKDTNVRKFLEFRCYLKPFCYHQDHNKVTLDRNWEIIVNDKKTGLKIDDTGIIFISEEEIIDLIAKTAF